MKPAWEPVIDGDLPLSVNPTKLLHLYVRLTHRAGTPGGPLFLSLKGDRPLKADSIGSLTKQMLHKFGVDMSVWGPHSTRGAGVALYKNMGLSSEQVCELGQWKNAAAFSAHYLRLGAASSAAKSLVAWVHNDSPGEGVEPEWSRTPTTEEEGGRDLEGEAPKPGEPARPSPRKWQPTGRKGPENRRVAQLTAQ